MDTRLVAPLGVLGLVAFVALALWLQARFRSSPRRVTVETKPQPALPPSSVPPKAHTKKCRYCLELATRGEAVVLEHSSKIEKLAEWLPIAVVATRYQRDAAKELTVCDMHGALADRAVDLHLAQDAQQLAEHLMLRAQRMRRFVVETLPAIVKGEPS